MLLTTAAYFSFSWPPRNSATGEGKKYERPSIKMQSSTKSMQSSYNVRDFRDGLSTTTYLTCPKVTLINSVRLSPSS